MSQFLGTHHNRLDSKGRVSIPAAFRSALRANGEATPATLTIRPSHQYPCIEAWPVDLFMSLAKPLDTLDLFSQDMDDMQYALYPDAYTVEADKEGRIVVPDSLVQHAGLTETVTFMGVGRRFQIWEPAGALKRVAEARARVRDKNLTLPAGIE